MKVNSRFAFWRYGRYGKPRFRFRPQLRYRAHDCESESDGRESGFCEISKIPGETFLSKTKKTKVIILTNKLTIRLGAYHKSYFTPFGRAKLFINCTIWKLICTLYRLYLRHIIYKWKLWSVPHQCQYLIISKPQMDQNHSIRTLIISFILHMTSSNFSSNTYC